MDLVINAYFNGEWDRVQHCRQDGTQQAAEFKFRRVGNPARK
jgi:hypothetical protein